MVVEQHRRIDSVSTARFRVTPKRERGSLLDQERRHPRSVNGANARAVRDASCTHQNRMRAPIASTCSRRITARRGCLRNASRRAFGPAFRETGEPRDSRARRRFGESRTQAAGLFGVAAAPRAHLWHLRRAACAGEPQARRRTRRRDRLQSRIVTCAILPRSEDAFFSRCASPRSEAFVFGVALT